MCSCGVARMREGVIFFFKQKTAYEMRISDWSADVCSSDLRLLQQTESSADSSFATWSPKCDIRAILLHVLSNTTNRSEERCVGKERVSTCRSRWSTQH